MAHDPPDNDDSTPEKDSPNLSDGEVDHAFSELAAQFQRDSLTGPRDYIPTEESDEFVPPDPGPVASSDTFLNLGWFLLAGGLFLILGSLIFWPSAPRIFHLVCIGAAFAGGAILVWRMPHHKDDDDDLGAVV